MLLQWLADFVDVHAGDPELAGLTTWQEWNYFLIRSASDYEKHGKLLESGADAFGIITVCMKYKKLRDGEIKDWRHIEALVIGTVHGVFDFNVTALKGDALIRQWDCRNWRDVLPRGLLERMRDRSIYKVGHKIAELALIEEPRGLDIRGTYETRYLAELANELHLNKKMQQTVDGDRRISGMWPLHYEIFGYAYGECDHKRYEVPPKWRNLRPVASLEERAAPRIPLERYLDNMVPLMYAAHLLIMGLERNLVTIGKNNLTHYNSFHTMYEAAHAMSIMVEGEVITLHDSNKSLFCGFKDKLPG